MAKITQYLRKTLFLLGVFLFVALLFFLYQKHKSQYCKAIHITVDAPEDGQLITESLIKNKLDEWYAGGLSGIAKDQIDLMDIESRINQIPAVKKSEVSFALNGDVQIDIKQRTPILRVVSHSSYYLDDEFFKIPTFETFPARVPIANGVFSSDMIKKIYTLARYVYESPFAKPLSEQIFVEDTDLMIIPKIKNQKIVIGDTLDLDDKFDRLEKFYKNGLSNIGYNKYNVINLKFKGQVVCN